MGIRRLAIANPSATTDTTLFTADNQYLISVIATNKSSNTSATIRVWVEPSGATLDSQFAYIVYDIPVDASNSYETFRFAINQNDEVHVYTSNATISFQSYGLVQYDVNLGVGISSYQASAPAYVWSSSANDWIPMAGSFDASLNNTFTGTNIFTGSVTIPGYEKSIPLQSSAPSSPASSDLWVDNTTPTAPQLKVYNGSSWVALGNTVNDSQAVIAQRMFA
jgi:hypothetical protein